MEDNIPLIFFDRVCTELKTDRVVTDDYNGAYMAVEHLIKTGCKRIAFFSAPSNMEISKNRENGYIDALRSYSLPVDRSLIFECDSKEKAIKLTPEVLAMENRPDAFFCINDDTASGVLYAAKRSGFSVPEDISICGFGDGEVAKACDPALTTIEQNGYDMGVKACTLLVNRIKNGNTLREVNHSVIRTSLVVRESTK